MPWARVSNCQCCFLLLWRGNSREALKAPVWLEYLLTCSVRVGKQMVGLEGSLERGRGVKGSEVIGKKFASLMSWLMLEVS